jgi:hypothetical protein
MGMRISIRNSQNEDGLFNVAVMEELQKLWLPIAHEKGLHLVEYAITAGLTLDKKYYQQMREELQTLLAEIEKAVPYEDDFVNPAFRCRRLIKLLDDNPPESGAQILVG